jgi:hypothetical protein
MRTDALIVGTIAGTKVKQKTAEKISERGGGNPALPLA